MKKLFTTLLLLLGAVLVINAQTKKLKVGDQQIDLTQDGYYTGIGDENGTATYTVSEKRLYLKNIHLTDKMISGQDLSDGTYYISLQSDLYVMQFSRFCMRFDRSNITFEGNGFNLVLNGVNNKNSGYSTFDAEDSNVTFQNVFLEVSSDGSDAFYGRNSITFNCVYASVYSIGSLAFRGFKSMSFSDCKLGAGLEFVSGTGVIDIQNSSLSASVQLRPFLRFGRTIVPTGYSTSSDTNWSWDRGTKTLSLKNVECGKDGQLENYGIDNLTVKFMGTNKLTGIGEKLVSQGAAIYSEKNMNITGYGTDLSKLILTGTRGIDIYPFANAADNRKITFTNIDVSIDANGKGIFGHNIVDLAINNSSLTVSGQSEGSIVGFKSCTMTDCDVDTEQSPNVCFRSSLNGFGTPTALYKSNIYIKTLTSADKYNVSILGKTISKLNKKRVAVDGLTAGTITFDSDAKKLTLNNVTLEAPSGDTNDGIHISGVPITDNYTISLAGTNTITTNGDACFISGTTEFTGSGKGFFISNTKSGLNISPSGSVILNSTNIIRFEGKTYGCYGSNSKNEVLTLKKTSSDNYYYRFRGDTKCIHNLNMLKLDGTDFYGKGENLKGCYFDEANKDVRQNGGKEASGWVGFAAVKETYPIYIADKMLNDLNSTGVGSKYITAGDATAVTYNGSTKTLTLTDATVTNMGEDMNALKNSGVDGLTINVVGDNTLQTERSGWNGDNTSVNISSNTTITGNGTLNVKGIGPLYVSNGKKLTIKDAKKIVVEKNIRSNTSSSTAELVVDNSNVESTSVGLFKSVTWLNGSLAEPVNGKFDPESTYIVDANGNKASRVVFIDQAATAIDAVEVDNNADIRSIYDANGRQMDSARKGLNIIRMSDGTVRKVMVK